MTVKQVQFLIVCYSSLSCTRLYILHNIFLSEVCCFDSSDCVNVQSLRPYIRVCFARVLYILTFITVVSNCECEYMCMYIILLGIAVAQWLRCCATNEKVAGAIPASVSGFFIDIKSFRSHNGPGVDSASNRNEY